MTASLTSGGSERVLSIMSHYWSDRKWDVTMLSLASTRVVPFYELHSAVTYRALDLQKVTANPAAAARANAQKVRGLRRAIKDSRPDAVISFIESTNVLAVLASLGTRIPVIVSERTDPRLYALGPHWSTMRALTYPFASSVIVQSEGAKSFFSRRLQARIKVIPNPVVREPKSSETSARECGEPVQRTVVGMGRLSPEKGFDLLIEAFATIAGPRPNWSLVIWGEGPCRDRLEALVAARQMQGRVYLPGVTTAPAREMRRSDLFVLASRFEGFPNALVEAMSLGLPVVAFRCGGAVEEIIRDGYDGELVEGGDVRALATSIAVLMDDDAKRARLAAAAPSVTDRYSLDKVMRLWEEAIDEAMRKPLHAATAHQG